MDLGDATSSQSASVPTPPRSKILALGSFIASGVHKVGDSVESRITTSYTRKIESTERCEDPKSVGTGKMQAAKAVYLASQGFAVVAGGTAKVVEGVAQAAGAKVAGKKGDGLAARCITAVAEVQESISDRAESVVATAAQCHLEYQEHAEGPDAAQFSRYVGGTAKHVTSGYFDAQKVAHPVKGLSKGIAKGLILGDQGEKCP